MSVADLLNRHTLVPPVGQGDAAEPEPPRPRIGRLRKALIAVGSVVAAGSMLSGAVAVATAGHPTPTGRHPAKPFDQLSPRNAGDEPTPLATTGGSEPSRAGSVGSVPAPHAAPSGATAAPSAVPAPARPAGAPAVSADDDEAAVERDTRAPVVTGRGGSARGAAPAPSAASTPGGAPASTGSGSGSASSGSTGSTDPAESPAATGPSGGPVTGLVGGVTGTVGGVLGG